MYKYKNLNIFSGEIKCLGQFWYNFFLKNMDWSYLGNYSIPVLFKNKYNLEITV